MRKTHPILLFTLAFIIVTIISTLAVLIINGSSDNTTEKTTYASDNLVKSSDISDNINLVTLWGNWECNIGSSIYTYEIKSKEITTYINGEKYGKSVEYVYDNETGKVSPKNSKDLFPLCDYLVLEYVDASFNYKKLVLNEYTSGNTPNSFTKISTFSLP